MQLMMRHWRNSIMRMLSITNPLLSLLLDGRTYRRCSAASSTRQKMVCIVENIIDGGEWVVLEWSDPLGLTGCGCFQIIDGKIKTQRGYWDKLSFLKQHNLPLE